MTYRKGDYKHDCPRPLTGCDYPNCRCDSVDDDPLSHLEVKAIERAKKKHEERDHESIDPDDYTR